MSNSVDFSGKLALDSRGLGALRESARQQSPESIKAAAKQFEALFMNMVMKSMREATPQDGMFDNQQTKMYTSMLDQQLSQTLANRGVGLADVLARQLSANRGLPPPAPGEAGDAGNAATGGAAADGISGMAPVRQLNPQRQAQIAAFQEQLRLQNEEGGSGMTPGGMPGQAGSASGVAEAGKSRSRHAHVRAFEDRLAHHADEASRATGIPAKFMLGQAALETGWGKREIRGADGSNSFNLFGIKATGGWKGKVVEVATTEYVNGAPQIKREKFRAYDSYADSFRDYARLLGQNPRYENVIANAQDASGFAHGLQRAGYATDPQYAAKLTRIIQQTLSA
ncbi:flagellar assembly peptidoglycan hydrolase FlgJ [Janthinobacterium sp. 17J80-10]|uniref:flagellar assembly peptidoglycan hydrolase FlgJ n=1 Tax=Janthinobacterium sp. 17J80-10 TaxID=2497863 RepID=UPI0010058878|nr:flagellar assembly peptidoglycan hydrolase FlgJ [Janthinobacterium sp. 17J80-10]QAU34350.1 flagellar assembly peptidoglycan hydrolase FlgJ [Janthinobacterium sp. 17J80-10]